MEKLLTNNSLRYLSKSITAIVHNKNDRDYFIIGNKFQFYFYRESKHIPTRILTCWSQLNIITIVHK